MSQGGQLGYPLYFHPGNLGLTDAQANLPTNDHLSVPYINSIRKASIKIQK